MGLHAPDDKSFSEEDFHSVNVIGTENVLSCAASSGIPVVYTSTTSLMITQEVKDRMAGGETVWLDEGSSQSTPRNKYGRSKLAAEKLCLAEAHAAPVVVLRPPRFFKHVDCTMPEDFTGMDNVRAVELFSGRRAALERAMSAAGLKAFAAAGWQLPEAVDRVYDGAAAWKDLGWRPQWTPATLIKRLVRKEPRALSAAF